MDTSHLSQRVLSTIGLGFVTATRDDAPVRVMQARMSEMELRDNVPLVQHYGFASRPKPGANLVLLFQGGDRTQGVAIASHDQRVTLRLSEGEVAIHTDEGDHVYFQRGRVVEVVAGTKVRFVTPKLECTGDVVAHADSGPVHLATHTHTGVQTGGGTSGPPTAGS